MLLLLLLDLSLETGFLFLFFQMETIQKRQRGKEMLEGAIRFYQMLWRHVDVNSRETAFHSLRVLRLVGVITVTTGLRLHTTAECRIVSSCGDCVRQPFPSAASAILCVFSWNFGHG